MGRPKGKPVKRRRFVVLLSSEDDQAARIVTAARVLQRKGPALGSALRDLLQQEAQRIEARGRQRVA